MKKFYLMIFMTCLLTITFGHSVFADTIIKYRLEPSGTLTDEYSSIHSNQNFSAQFQQNVDSTFSIAAEFLQQSRKELLFGGGIEYQPTRRAEGSDNGFNFIPLYFLARTNTKNSKKVNPYLIGKIGYNLYQEENPENGFKLNGGLYYGFGAGLAIQKSLQMELTYACNNGEAESEDLNLAIEHNYSEIGFSIGYRF